MDNFPDWGTCSRQKIAIKLDATKWHPTLGTEQGIPSMVNSFSLWIEYPI